MTIKVLLKNFVSVLVPAAISCLFVYFFSFYLITPPRHLVWAIAALSIYCLIMNVVYAAMAGKSLFTGLMLVGSLLKMLFSFIALFFYSIVFSFFSSFALQYILVYLTFTFFDIYYLLYLIKQQKKT